MVVYSGQLDKCVVVTAFVWMKPLNPFTVKSDQVFAGHFFQLLRRFFEQDAGLLQIGFSGFKQRAIVPSTVDKLSNVFFNK